MAKETQRLRLRARTPKSKKRGRVSARTAQQGCSGALAGVRGVALRRASGEKRRVLRVASACAPTDHSGQHHQAACQCRTKELGGTTRRAGGNSSDKEMNTHLNDAVDMER
ncbi:hypothetical protein ERJ75_001722500 [Trypanosoma vivax]|nr:hypothetical protein ERJ75_001722500 [Trypanosoma vivax]